MNDTIDPNSPNSIRHQLRSILLTRIAEGLYPPGRRFPSERALSELFGVSRTSVRETIAQLISEGILNRATGRGTFIADRQPVQANPTVAPRRQVGFWISASVFNFVQPGYSQILTGAGEVCRNRGYRLQFHAVDEGRQTLEVIFADDQRTGGLDGNLVVGGVNRHVLQRLGDLDCPLLSVDLLVSESSGDAVRIDYDSGIRQAVDHLAGLGHKEIGFIGFPGSRKYEAFWQSLDAAGLPFLPRYMRFLSESNLEPGMLAGYECMRRLLSGGRLPTALVVTNDYVAIGVLDALAMADIRVPEALSVVGCDDLALSTRPLTTIQVDLVEVGRRAASALLDRIETQSPPEGEILIPVRLVVRATTAPPPPEPALVGSGVEGNCRS